MATVQGTCDPKFEAVKASLQKHIDDGEELGAGIVVNVDGKNVVDLWGGYADEARTKPWEKDTIVNIWSSTKNISALAVLMCHDRGLLDVNENVAKYWPEFAANGKENVKVRNILSHSSGLSAWDPPFSVTEFYDLKDSTERLAKQAPWWEPGTASGYHALSYGQLCGELVRRTSGKSLKQFVADEIAGPLHADLQIGAKESDWKRISNVIPPPPLPIDFGALGPDHIATRTFTSPQPDANAANTPEWRKAELGAVNGHANARSLARVFSAISLGGAVDSHKLLSQETIDMIFKEQTDGVDLALMQPLRYGIGFGIVGGSTDQSLPFMPAGKHRKVCYWGGWGGSFELMDLDKRTTITYAMNKMGPGTLGSSRTHAYIREVYNILG